MTRRTSVPPELIDKSHRLEFRDVHDRREESIASLTSPKPQSTHRSRSSGSASRRLKPQEFVVDNIVKHRSESSHKVEDMEFLVR